MLENCASGDLYRIVQQTGRVQEEGWMVSQVLLPLLQTLAYLHNEGIIHRDVKPEHVLFNSERVAKLSGFFLAQARCCDRIYCIPGAGTRCGAVGVDFWHRLALLCDTATVCCVHLRMLGNEAVVTWNQEQGSKGPVLYHRAPSAISAARVMICPVQPAGCRPLQKCT